jgi:putative colanic acid biosynthesis UDP-glucose lipid carrier transferase
MRMLYKPVQTFFQKGCFTFFRVNDPKTSNTDQSIIQMMTDPDFIFLEEEIAGHKKKKISNIYLQGKKQYFAWKRIFDIVISFVVIVAVLSWLTPIIAIIILLDSGGPVFFFQKRVGRGGRTFTCYKFRSMVRNENADRMQAIPNDKRITFIGNILRKSNLDELPQFLNVLLGDMSIVGPRPHMHADHYHFSLLIKGYEFRNLIRPGITGLAQVRGFSGPATDMESIFGRYQWDAFYVRNAGAMIDFRILKKTISQQFSFWFRPLFSRFFDEPDQIT